MRTISDITASVAYKDYGRWSRMLRVLQSITGKSNGTEALQNLLCHGPKHARNVRAKMLKQGRKDARMIFLHEIVDSAHEQQVIDWNFESESGTGIDIPGGPIARHLLTGESSAKTFTFPSELLLLLEEEAELSGTKPTYIVHDALCRWWAERKSI